MVSSSKEVLRFFAKGNDRTRFVTHCRNDVFVHFLGSAVPNTGSARSKSSS
jgi:hypothetical protein